MNRGENFLHTTHRTVTWFNKAFGADDLVLSPPYQRNAVWTDSQKSFLLDTILSALPIPELYMQDRGDETGEEKHIVVDGQQRIRAVLDFIQGNYKLSGDDVARKWRGLSFNDLSTDDKKAIFAYKFVVRILPPDLQEDDIRRVFARINKNTVTLNDQELRNATYWGPFIKTIQRIGDDDPYWAESGLFSATDHRRMLDHEFISELAIAYLHGPQNKKDKLDTYYLLYEESFDDQDDMISAFKTVTSEISRVMPRILGTRWRKKSDFYTMFLAFAARRERIPFDPELQRAIGLRIHQFGAAVDEATRIEGEDRSGIDPNVISYASAVSRAASDRGSRVNRARAFSLYVFQEEPSRMEAGAHSRVASDESATEEAVPVELAGTDLPDATPAEI